MRLKTIFKILHETKYVKSVLRHYSDSMVCGKYYQHNSFHALSLNNTATLAVSRRYFDVKTPSGRMAGVAARLNRMGYFRNRNKRSTEEYEALYIANNYDKKREVKLFSFKGNKILTVCTSSEAMESQIVQYERFGKVYNMPRVMKNGKYENSFEIAMIARKPFASDATALAHIARSTMAYNQTPQELSRIAVTDLCAPCDEPQMNVYMEQVKAMIAPGLLNMPIPMCLQHGDLSKDNLMYGECEGKTDFWWIDWEHARERVFFYDFFFYILNSAFYGDMSVFHSYMSDEIDDSLDAYFSHFGLCFNRENKMDYLLLYALPFLSERVCAKGYVLVLKAYVELLQSMEREVRGC